jgi:molybdopterin-guanine dinucleotide biosynthesis protein A
MKPRARSLIEICILAGGLSRRMGHDKSRLKLGGSTMLAHIRATAKALGLPVRVIRRDVVARCGPMGGVYTALKTTRADTVLFLACDMPFISDKLLHAVLKHFGRKDTALFARFQGKPGFPFVLDRTALTIVSHQIRSGSFSLRELSLRLKARLFTPPARLLRQLRNINTPEEWVCAVRLFEKGARAQPGAKGQRHPKSPW